MSNAASLQSEFAGADDRRADPWFVAAGLSFEMVFVLFLMAGRYKADPRFAWLTDRFSIDITAMLLAASVAAGVVVALGRRYRFPSAAGPMMVAATALFGYAVASLLWSPGVVYAQTKALHVGVLTLGTLLAAAVVIASHRYRVERFLLLFTLFSVWLAVESHASHVQDVEGRSVEALGGNYLGLGRMIGAAALIALGNALYGTGAAMEKTVSLALFLGFCFVLLILGGRMPLLAMGAGAVAPFCLALLSDPRRAVRGPAWIHLAILAAAVAGAVLLLAADQLPQTLRRMGNLFEPDLGRSAFSRVEHYRAAWDFWWERPVFGHGIGAWPMLYLRNDVRAYPHNLVLEVLVELGLVGLMLLLWLFRTAWRSLGALGEIRRDPLRIVLVMLAVNALANAMVSGDLSDNRFLFGVLGLMCLPRARSEQNKGYDAVKKTVSREV